MWHPLREAEITRKKRKETSHDKETFLFSFSIRCRGINHDSKMRIAGRFKIEVLGIHGFAKSRQLDLKVGEVNGWREMEFNIVERGVRNRSGTRCDIKKLAIFRTDKAKSFKEFTIKVPRIGYEIEKDRE